MPPLKYWKIKEYLESIVVKPESVIRMPTVRELMKQFNVSLATVNRALIVLENDGVIVRRQGAGISAAQTARSGGALRKMEKNNDDRELVLAYADYPSDRVWSNVHTTMQCAAQRKHQMYDYKIYQSTSTATLMRCIRDHPRCRGVVLMPGADRMDAERLEALAELRVPVALLDGSQFYDPMPDNVRAFNPDPADSARKTVALLVSRGHRRIGVIRNEPQSDYIDRYIKSLFATFREMGVPFGADNLFNAAIRSWESAMDAAVAQTRKHLDDIRRMGLTAIIYISTAGALAAVRVLRREGGFRIPEDVSIVSDGDAPLYGYLDPALTTVSANYEDMCRAAVDYAAGFSMPQEKYVLFPLSVVERESVLDLRAVAVPACTAR